MKYTDIGINRCEVCGSSRLLSVLDLGLHPMCDDLVPVGDERQCLEYPIEILFCSTCLTAHQKFQVPKRDLFPVSYHYRSRFTADVLRGMESLVATCAERFGSLAGKNVLDIGCNDGSLLDFFRKHGCKTIGVEPTGASQDAEAKGHSIFHDYLSTDVAQAIVSSHGKPDFITFTNVFAHIEDLTGVLESLKVLMGSETVLVIENHYLGAVLRGNQFDTFYHEHPRTYSYTSFVHIARSLGVNLLDAEFPSRYGGNIRVFMGQDLMMDKYVSTLEKDELSLREDGFLEGFAVLRNNMEHWRISKKRMLDTLVQMHGPLQAKAFPGRAAILIKLLNLDEQYISAVYEKPGSMKIGHYLPGTRIPICSDDDFLVPVNKSAPLLNLAWHISSEIRHYLSDHGYTGTIVDILNTEDFVGADDASPMTDA